MRRILTSQIVQSHIFRRTMHLCPKRTLESTIISTTTHVITSKFPILDWIWVTEQTMTLGSFWNLKSKAKLNKRSRIRLQEKGYLSAHQTTTKTSWASPSYRLINKLLRLRIHLLAKTTLALFKSRNQWAASNGITATQRRKNTSTPKSIQNCFGFKKNRKRSKK